MGIESLKELVDDGQPVSPEEIAAAEAEHVENAYADRTTRVDIEETFATEREAIDRKYDEDVRKAAERRDNKHAKNRDKQQKAYEKTGLNPNGSDPRGREQDVL